MTAGVAQAACRPCAQNDGRGLRQLTAGCRLLFTGSVIVAVFALTACAPPCVPFSRPAHEVSCDGDRLVATFNAQNSSVPSASCTANVDGGVVVATVTGVVCPGEQFERLANMLRLECALPSLESGTVPVHEGQVALVSDGGVTVCRSP